MNTSTTDGDSIKLRECLEIHLRTGQVLNVVAPQGLRRFIQTEAHENNVIGVSYMRGTGNGSIFYGFYTHLMEERDWNDYNQQHPTEELASRQSFSTTYQDNDNILRERLGAILKP